MKFKFSVAARRKFRSAPPFCLKDENGSTGRFLLRVHAVGRKDEHILLQLRHAAAERVDRTA